MRLSHQALLSIIAIGLALTALYLAIARTTPASSAARGMSAASAGSPASAHWPPIRAEIA